MRKDPGFLFLFLIWMIFSVPASGQGILKLVPKISELENWKMAAETVVYDDDKLYDLINGGADIYFEYGFVQVVSARYNDPKQNLIQLEIYEMKDDAAAYGIFSLTQQSATWSKTYGNISAATTDYIAFWKGVYYVNISWSSRQHQDAPLLSQLAGLTDQKIKTAGIYPEMVRLFEAMDVRKKTVYMKGNLALTNYYYFDYKNIFELSEGIACTSGNHHRIVIRYPDTGKAQSVLTASRQTISNNKRFTDVAMSFQGYTCKDNKGNRILIRQVENYLVIIVSLKENVSLIPLMDEVTQKIESLN